MSTRTQLFTIVRNLASYNARRMILLHLDHELRALDQARHTTNGINVDIIEGQGWITVSSRNEWMS